jgi:small subunit ribosomal protein S24e
MEITVEREKTNPLLKRREIYFRLRYMEDGPTPSRSAVREKIAGLFNANPETIVVDYIKPEFGKSEAICYAKIYESNEELLKTEPKHIIKRNFGGEEEES